ncbi:MAG: hypothetical protein ACTHN3_02975 [Solirubrobacterales bacterium]
MLTTLRRPLMLAVAICCAAWIALGSTADADPSEYGLESVNATESTTVAGAHPDLTMGFRLKTDPNSPADSNGFHETYAALKDMVVALPPGLIGNPNALPQCGVAEFAAFISDETGCSLGTQVGVIHILQRGLLKPLTEPVFNMVPPSNGTVARLGFYSGTLPYFITFHVRTGSDYGITAKIEDPPSSNLISATTEIWGVPGDSSHDNLRLTPSEAYPEFKTESPPRLVGVPIKPYISNPTSCGMPLAVEFSTDSYADPGVFSSMSAPFPAISGCDSLEFDPSFTALPTSQRAGSPTGLETTLKVPQNESVKGRATAQLREARVILPKGLAIAPGGADGLAACSAQQVRLGEDVVSGCPAASQIGTAEFDVPALSRRVEGAVYQRTPEAGHLFRIWLVTDELGVHVKIGGEIDPDPRSGQLTAIFSELPQVPVRELKLRFKSGSHGVLVNPSTCGTFETFYDFEPWSGNPPTSGTTPMQISEDCAQLTLSPDLVAGTLSPSAATFSPFLIRLTRNDREANVLAISTTLPAGVLAKLKGVPVCPDDKAAAGACESSSHIGSITAAVGAGPTPLWIPQPGKKPTSVFLAGPYRDAPYSAVFAVPAQAGPFDLGTVVVRAGIYVDPSTTRVTVKSDPLPQILEGVPISYRAIEARIDRPHFTLNPTNCDRKLTKARVSAVDGATSTVTSPFQAANCASLPFRPKLSLKLSGPTKRAAFPRLRAVITARRGEANIRRVSVALPHSEFLEQAHIRTICTRVQFTADACPSGSIYGHARLETRLLGAPLTGPVYLRSSSHPLPDLVIALHGAVDVDLAGRIDSVNGGIRTTFENVPDAPFSKLVLSMKGGKKGLLVNSRDICRRPAQVTAKLRGQNDKTADQHPVLRAQCAK